MTNPRTPTRSSHTSLRFTAVLVVAVALTSAACSAGSPGRAQTQSAAGSTTGGAKPVSTSSTPPGSDGGGTETTQGASTSDTAPSKSKVIATTTGEQPADPNDDTPVPLRLDVNSAKRLAGDVVEVRLTITNLSDTASLEPYGDFEDGANYADGPDYTLSGAVLVDLPHDKRYLALIDSESTCLCTDLNNRVIAPGDAMAMYVQLSAPAKGVTTMGFTLPGFDPINDLAIS